MRLHEQVLKSVEKVFLLLRILMEGKDVPRGRIKGKNVQSDLKRLNAQVDIKVSKRIKGLLKK
jgi:hypothetical protein